MSLRQKVDRSECRCRRRGLQPQHEDGPLRIARQPLHRKVPDYRDLHRHQDLEQVRNLKDYIA